MRYSVRITAYGGVGAILLLFGLLFVVPSPVQAQEERVTESAWITVEPFTILILVVGASCVVCFGVGVKRARRKDAWPHWRAILLGLGEAAFLLGVIGTFRGMGEAFDVLASIGAAVNPADVAEGYSRSVDRLVLGGWVALAALMGAAILGLAAAVPSRQRGAG
jgi:hypothetical protein